MNKEETEEGTAAEKDGEAAKGVSGVEKTVVDAYKKIEDTVVGGYKAIENSVVGTYKKIEGKFVDTFLEKEEGVSEKNTEE